MCYIVIKLITPISILSILSILSFLIVTDLLLFTYSRFSEIFLLYGGYMNTFYVLDSDDHFVCIVKASRFDIVDSHVLMLCFYDKFDNVIAYFDSLKFKAHDHIVLFDGSILCGEGLKHDK